MRYGLSCNDVDDFTGDVDELSDFLALDEFFDIVL